MPRNEVVERMAKKLHTREARNNENVICDWSGLAKYEKDWYRDDALELLGIEGDELHKWTLKDPFPSAMKVKDFKAQTRSWETSESLQDAFRLARETRERRENR